MSRPSPDSLVAAGEQALRDGQVATARSLFEQALRSNPRHSRANERLAYLLGQAGQWDAAQRLLQLACEDPGASPEALFHLGSLWLQRERPQEAARCFQRSLARAGDFFEGLHELGTAQSRMGEARAALESYRKAARLNPGAFQVFFNIGRMQDELGEADAAIENYGRAIALQPAFAASWSHRGIALSGQRRHAEALADHQRATALDPQDADAWINQAVTLGHLRRHAEALACCDRAVELAPGHPDAWTSQAVVLDALRRHEEALSSHDRALALAPAHARVIVNRAHCLAQLGRRDEALAALARANELAPDLAQAWSDRGTLMAAAGRHAEALGHYQRALQLRPDDAETLTNLGMALGVLGRRQEAVRALQSALGLDPGVDYLLGEVVNARMALCDWAGVDVQVDAVVQRLRQGARVIAPFPAVVHLGDPELAQRAAAIWVADRCPVPAVPAPAARPGHDRIVIGYYSADFHDHATAFLMAEFFERHDRSRFELLAFSFGPDVDDASRRRLRGAFDQFIDVRDVADEEVVRRSRELGVDVAVDLKGFTLESRPGIFARRAAPIQVSWLGYPGTTSLPTMDYVLADRVVIAPGDEPFFSEKVVRLPRSYQVNDGRREISARRWTRPDAGLPAEGVVFCCFNNNYKITPATFACWMRILRQVEGSVLWLLQGEPASADNLRREAGAAGIDPGRLVFAGFEPQPDHLARYALADLFLDTLPCNAHTTASDALWCGVPVLTRIGRGFAGRVAASLLHAVGLPELVTDTEAEYERLAVHLATDANQLARLRDHLVSVRATAPLFDTEASTRAIEWAYGEMVRRQRAGLPPDGFTVPA